VVNTIRRPKLLMQQDVVVFAEGENVVLRVGNSDLTMYYQDALRISQFIRVHAKEAKRNAGDQSRHWSAYGVLGDANKM